MRLCPPVPGIWFLCDIDGFFESPAATWGARERSQFCGDCILSAEGVPRDEQRYGLTAARGTQGRRKSALPDVRRAEQWGDVTGPAGCRAGPLLMAQERTCQLLAFPTLDLVLPRLPAVISLVGLGGMSIPRLGGQRPGRNQRPGHNGHL